jgi:shikimate kinase
MNLYLIGYRCTGKTSVGRRLAAKLERTFVDTDTRITEEAGMSVADIVAKEGWEAFRRAEASLLETIAARDGYVVSTGGGVVLQQENRRLMRQNGLSVWLTARPATILKRMSADRANSDFRPALTGRTLEKEVRQTLAERIPLYAQMSDMAVATDYFSIEDACEAIVKWLGSRR